MKVSFALKALVAAVALSAAGSAFAQTTISNGNTGDGSLFLNVWDSTNSTSYTLDLSATSVLGSTQHMNEFNGGGTLTFNLGSDSNWTSFLSGIGGSDSVQYNILGLNTPAGGVNQLDLTSNAAKGTTSGKVGSTTNSQLSNISNINTFINAINTSGGASAISVTTNSSNPWYYGTGNGIPSGVPNTLAALGTALSFYQLADAGTGNLGKASVLTYAGTWNLTSAGLLSYGSVSAVPLPKSLVLLLSGLVLMGVIARRGKTGPSGDSFPGAAA